MNETYWNNNYAICSAPDAYDGWLDKYTFLPGESVLDLGCGAGTNLPVLLKLGVRLTAADLSKNAVELVRAAFGRQLCAADCFDMREGFPYPDDSFDTVVADLSLHYFCWADTCRIITELQRIIQRSGRLIARVHSLRNLDAAHAEKIEEGYYLAYGYPRRYFATGEIRKLFHSWQLLHLEETTALRYSTQKHIIEFVASRS